MSGEKTSVHTLVINAIPQGHIEAVVAATLCSNFIHVTCREVGGGSGSGTWEVSTTQPLQPQLYSEGLSLHLCAPTTHSLEPLSPLQLAFIQQILLEGLP